MNIKITVLIYLEGEDEKAARKTLDSVLAQKTDFGIQIIVCDLASVLEQGIYDYDECDLIYIPVKEETPRFELEMALREQIQSTYFTVIYDEEYLTDQKYLQRAVDFLDKEEDFSMYGANAYMGNVGDVVYHLSDSKSMLIDLEYKKNVIYGIEDYMYNLDLDGKTVVWLEAPMLVCRNNVSNAEMGDILEQEKLVQNIFTKRRGLNLLYLKKGMCLLEERVVACCRCIEDEPTWKQHLQQSLEVYALQYYYADRVSPKRIWDRVHIEYIKGGRELKQWEQEGNRNIRQEDQLLLEFLTRKCGEQIEQSPLWMQSYGDNYPDKLFFVLQMSIRGMGVFSTLFNFLGAVDFAEQNGAQVLIDLKSAYMYGMQNVKQRGRENAWEYYFKQPTKGYTLDEVYKSKNVIKCDTYYWCNPTWYDMFPVEKSVLHKWGGLIKKYFQMTPELQERCRRLYDEMLKDKRILGVCIRNNFALLDAIGAGLSQNHPRQPGLDIFIADIHKYMAIWNCDYIYGVVDDTYALQKLQREFGTRCLCMERKRTSNFKEDKPVKDIVNRVPEGWDTVENNKAYICDTYLLSRCTSLLSGNCGCGRMAYYWNDGQYEHVKVFEEGRY